MNKNLFLVLLLTSIYLSSSAQVGINILNPQGDFEVESNSEGFLIPRIALTSKTSAAPIINPHTNDYQLVHSTLLYNTATVSGENGVTPGFYYWKDNTWVKISSGIIADIDWYKTNSTSAPTSVNDDTYTNGKIGIGVGQNDPNLRAPLHIYEDTGTTPSANYGSILLEHGNSGGSSSIVFKSLTNVNGSSGDYGYLSYSDDGSEGSTSENGLLEIGVLNDGAENAYPDHRDNINFSTSNSLGINTNNPYDSALLDLNPSDQGLLINRVQLSHNTDISTITGTEPDGLLVYNTTPAGTSPNNVVEGFYYWDNDRWNLIEISEGGNSNSGLQFYSYDTAELGNPDIYNIEKITPISKSGDYFGDLTYTAAFSVMDPSSNENGLIIKMVGTYIVKNEGVFNFSSISDDGARIYIDGSLISSTWAIAGGNEVASGSAYLAKGKHKFEFWYYEYNGPQTFSFSWGNNPDGNSGVINAQQFIIE